MNTRFLLVTFAIVATFLSCKTREYYQVYEVQSQNVSNEGGVLVDENEDCRITYNMWSDGGNLCFLFQNKTEKDMYVVMPKSFFIVNGLANNYYPQTFHSVTLASPVIDGIDVEDYIANQNLWYSDLSRYAKTYIGNVDGRELVCIPPGSSKFILGFNISNCIYKDCDNRNENYPKDKSRIVTFTQAESPVTFRNRIAYTFNEDGSDSHYIEHAFWLSSLRNYSEKAAISKIGTTDCESRLSTQVRVFNVSAPNKFYNRYVKAGMLYRGNGRGGYLSVRKPRN